jgi:hypothetical protein
LGKESIAEIIIDQIPVNYENYTKEIEEGISSGNYDKIRRAVHTLKSDFRHFIPVDDEFIKFIQDFEDDARDAAENNSQPDFTQAFAKFQEMAQGPLNEIVQLGIEYRNG